MGKTRQAIVSSHAKHGLGLLVDEELNFGLHAQTVAAKTSQTLGIFKRTFSSCSSSVVSKHFKGLIWPKLDFETGGGGSYKVMLWGVSYKVKGFLIKLSWIVVWELYS